MQIQENLFAYTTIEGSVKLTFTVISIILNRNVQTMWMEATAMKEDVQKDIGKFANS